MEWLITYDLSSYEGDGGCREHEPVQTRALCMRAAMRLLLLSWQLCQLDAGTQRGFRAPLLRITCLGRSLWSKLPLANAPDYRLSRSQPKRCRDRSEPSGGK